MSKDHTERKTYRKSPGRQYGYEYDPLNSRGSQKGASESRSGVLLERPNPKRTRQLMRQSIIASKRLNEHDQEHDEMSQYEEERLPSTPTFTPSRRFPSRTGRTPHGAQLVRTQDMEISQGNETDDDWYDMTVVDPDLEREDPLDRRMPRYADYRDDFIAAPPNQGKLTRRLPSTPEYEYPEEEEEFEYEYDEDDPSVKPAKKKRKLTRRGLLIGAGAAAAAGVGVVAINSVPKLPETIDKVTDNVQQQIEDAFNKGVSQGAEQARKELVNALQNLENFTLEGAIESARLTRIAYNVFVSPIIKFGSAVTSDFLTGMLSAFKKAREWLSGVYQDNATLAAIQKVLEAWVSQANTMPQQLDSITEADLDGAQAYLRALQRKLQEEKAKLNKPQAQSTPTAPAKQTPKAKQ